MDGPSGSNIVSQAHAVDIDLTTIPQRINYTILKLSTLSRDRIPHDDSCPICLVPFSSIAEGTTQNEGTLVLSDLPPGWNGEELDLEAVFGRAAEERGTVHGRDVTVSLKGVTRLEGCGHVFCRVDLIEWIRGRHGTCPACRHTFLDVKPPSDTDNESSDGDYIPGEDEEEDDDGFTDAEDYDVEMDFDFDMDDMDGATTDMETEGEIDLELDRGDVDVDYDTDVEGWTDDRLAQLGMGVGVSQEEFEDVPGLSDGYASESLSEGDVVISLLEDSVDSLVNEAADDAVQVYSTENIARQSTDVLADPEGTTDGHDPK